MLHPRIYCFLDERIGEARNHVTSHPEYKELQSRASLAFNNQRFEKLTQLFGINFFLG